MVEFKTTIFLFVFSCSCWAVSVIAPFSIPQQLLFSKLPKISLCTCVVTFSQGLGETQHRLLAPSLCAASSILSSAYLFHSHRFSSGSLAMFCLGSSSMYQGQEIIPAENQDILGTHLLSSPFLRHRCLALPLVPCLNTVASCILPSYIELFIAGKLVLVLVTTLSWWEVVIRRPF